MNVASCENTSAKMAMLMKACCNISWRAVATHVVAAARALAFDAGCLQFAIPYGKLGLSSSFGAYLVYELLLATTNQDMKV